MRLTFDSLVVVIFRILTGQAGSNWWLGENLILTFRTLDLIRQLVRRSGASVGYVGQGRPFVRLIGEEAQDTCKGDRSSDFLNEVVD